MWPLTSTTASSGATTSQAIPESACPVDHSTREAWAKQTTSSQLPSQPQQRPARDPNELSTDREISSIPRWLPSNKDSSTAGLNSTSQSIKQSASSASSSSPPTACPAHSTSATTTTPTGKEEEVEKWVYPSPSSFYSALQRKSRPADAQDMPIVVPIHNAVNEKVWQDVLDWERLALGKQRGEQVGSKLVSFVGRPKDWSPRARWRSFIGYQPPFDRHDWLVDRPLPPTPENPNPGSVRVRYVIDFYTGRGAALLKPDAATSTTSSSDQYMRPNLAFFIDCRPALDGYEGFRMRFEKGWERWFGASQSQSSSSRQQVQK